MATRETLRRFTLGRQRQWRSELVTLRDSELPKVDEGSEKKHPPLLDEAGVPLVVEVREPSIAARGAILKASKAASGKTDDIDIAALQLEAVVACTFVPGTQQPVFEAGDRQALLNQPPGGYFDELAAVALRLMNVESEKAAEKNSEGTASA